MNSETAKFESECSHSDIAAYLDGELDSVSELNLEMHIASCTDCFNALSEQKMVLCALNAALDQRPEIELPVNFARNVAVRAESGVNGLRKPEERMTASALCLALFVLVAGVLFVGNPAGFLEVLKAGLLMVLSVINVAAAGLYSVGLGLSVIIRAVSRYFVSESDLYVFGIFSILLVSVILCSSFYLRQNRFKF